ncbi:MAG: nucleotidyltransferase family protein [Bacteroidales bacterium]|nr:nucleotidyltransferase family protein [Bacteroidales bacterium]
MEATAENYLAWLRYALWGGDHPETLTDAALWLSDRQKTRGLVCDALLRSGVSVPRERAARMQDFLIRTYTTHQTLDTTLRSVVTTLTQAGIPSVLLKGQGAARNYPDPVLRECGDIDLFLGPEGVDEAFRLLAPRADSSNEGTDYKHAEVSFGDAEIELHRRTMIPETRRRERIYKSLEQEGLTRGLVPLNFGGVRVNTPEPTFNAFYLFYHAWHHFVTGGIGFRQLCDWMLLIHAQREQIDHARLRGILEAMRLLKPWQFFACIAVQDLGLPEAEMPCYDARRLRGSRRVLRTILREGNFGRGRKPRIARPKGYLPGKAYSLGLHFTRFVRLLPVAPREAWEIFVSLFVGGFRRLFKDLRQKV